MRSLFLEKVITNFKLDYSMLSTPNMAFFDRAIYLFNKYISIALNRREISYLGSTFFYDNRFSPALLESYPREILNLHKKIKFKTSRVLDIGANIGQFSYTLKKFYPRTEIYLFEPNKWVYNLLKRNMIRVRGVKTYNLGVGIGNKRAFYFSPFASPEGSFYKDNLSQNSERKNIKKAYVDVVELKRGNLNKLKLPMMYDLIKIDVEGAEIEVLKSIKDLRARFLLIEISLKRRGGSLRDVENQIVSNWGNKYKMIYYDLPNKKSPIANVLFKIG